MNASLPFVSTKSINELIEEGKVSPLFKKFNNIDFDLKLYKHQEQSIDKICNGKNVVITTGTGSGKTESFLYPILNTILKDIEVGNNEPGIRAIFLYPMNALVTDQMDRIRKILNGYSDIRYGFFTGETEEKSSKNLREKMSDLLGEEVPENEVLSREEIIKGYKKTYGKVDENEIDNMIKSIDLDGNGVIDYNEFLSCSMNKDKILRNENLELCFKAFDLDNSGRLSLNEIYAILKRGAKEDEDLEAFKEMLNDADENGDGEISLEEFKDIMKKFFN